MKAARPRSSSRALAQIAIAGLLSLAGCTNLIAAKAAPTRNFPRTWDEGALAAPVLAPAQVPAPVVAAKPIPSLTGLLAVLDFKNRIRGAEAEQVDAPYFANAIRGAMKKQAPALKVMTRENVLVLLQASGKKLEDCEGECEVDTGRRLGADYVLSGDLLKVGTSFKLDLRLHETKEGQLLSGTSLGGKTVDELDAGTSRAVTELLGAINR